MAVFKILFLFAAVQVVHPKPLLFDGMKMSKNFEFSLKPFVLPIISFTKEKWSPFGSFGVKHTIEKRSPFTVPPVLPISTEPSPAPLFQFQSSFDLKPSPPPPHPNVEEETSEHPPHVSVPPSHLKIHRIPKPPPVEHHESQLHTQVDIGPSTAWPPVSYDSYLHPHVGVSPVSSTLLPPPESPEEHLRELTRLPENHEVHNTIPPCRHNPQVTVGHEHLLEQLKPKENLYPASTVPSTLFEFSKSAVIQHGRGPPHPEQIPVLPPVGDSQGTLEGLFRPYHTGIPEQPVPTPYVPPSLTPVHPTVFIGQGTFPGYLRPPPPPRGPMLSDMARVDEINAYLKAIDSLPLIKPPLEENVIQPIPGNSVEVFASKESAPETKSGPFARGTRLALYFGNILLQVMSQAIGSARSAFSQYSMPSMS